MRLSHGKETQVTMYYVRSYILGASLMVQWLRLFAWNEPIFAWNIPLVSLIFLKRSLVFPILLFSSISLHWSLRKAFLSLLAILWNFAFKWVYLFFSPLPFTLFFSQQFVRPPQTTILHFHKGEKERYTHLNAEFQRIARRNKKAFLSDQCKEIEQNNRMGKTRDLVKKTEIPREHFMQRWTR